jgi:predicted MFS family arabinose efflux permease
MQRNADRPANRRMTIVTIVLSCFAAQSFARFSFSLLLPAMKLNLKISYGLIGWLGTINLAGYLLGTLLTSAASLRIPPHRLLQIGVVLSTVGLTMLAAVHSVPLLLAAMMCGGIGGAMTWIPAPLVASSVFPPERRAFALSIGSAAIGSGIVVATFLTLGIRRFANNPNLWRPIWLIEASIGALSIVLAFTVLKPVAIAPGSPPRLAVLRKAPNWWAPTLAYTCFGLGYVLFATYIVAALEKDAGFSKSRATLVFAALGVGNATGALSSSRLLRTFGRRVVMPVAFVGSGLGCLGVLAGVEPIVSISAFTFGFGMSAGVVSITSYLGEALRPQDFSAAFGAMTACFGVAQTIGPRLGGYMVDHLHNFTAVFTLAGSMWFLGALISLGLPKKERSLDTSTIAASEPSVRLR